MDSLDYPQRLLHFRVIFLSFVSLCSSELSAQQALPPNSERAVPLILQNSLPPQKDSAQTAPPAIPPASGEASPGLILPGPPDPVTEDPGLIAPDMDGDLEDLDALLDLSDKDISQLSQVQVARPSVAPALDAEVSTVERKKSTVGRTPAAVFVITREMIRRSGARHVPEVLRMAPGVQVAQLDSNKWAVSIRGFNSRFANKLLVQIDGRSVYNPLFAGTFWDAQGILLEDVERIEVLRGPGGAVWGANAVNGVINIVTRKAADTHGTFIEGGGGNVERSFGGFRQGGTIGQNGDIRVYGQWTERGPLESASQHDGWNQARVGARIDWSRGCDDSFTLQGDFYDGSSGTLAALASPTAPFVQLTRIDEQITGGNLLYRWNRELSGTSSMQLQTYYEFTERRLIPGGSHYERHRFDIDAQHSFELGNRHSFVWGGRYQSTWDELDTQPFFLSANPSESQYNVISAFVQDTIQLRPERLSLTLGTILSYNDFTGGEVQPSARLLWTPSDRVSSWMAVSRAVRTTSRITRDGRVVLPGQTTLAGTAFPVVNGSPELEAEDVLALEAGFRHQPRDEFSWDASVFYNWYDDLIGLGPPGAPTLGPEGIILPISFMNGGRAQTYGTELTSTFNINDKWRLQGNYTFLRMQYEGAVLGFAGDSPQHQVYLQSSHDLSDTVELDLIWRFVDRLPAQSVDGYSSFNVRLSWRPRDEIELFAVGTNLFDGSHAEFGNEALGGVQSTEVPRGVYGGLALRF